LVAGQFEILSQYLSALLFQTTPASGAALGFEGVQINLFILAGKERREKFPRSGYCPASLSAMLPPRSNPLPDCLPTPEVLNYEKITHCDSVFVSDLDSSFDSGASPKGQELLTS
jgi:hypothetical protein